MRPGNQTPVNKTAALVISADDSYVPSPLKPNESEVPIAYSYSPSRADLIGRVFGRLTVMGKGEWCRGRQNSSGRHRWVCKCVCGVWLTRRQNSLIGKKAESKAARGIVEACSRCERAEILKKRSSAPL